MEENKVEHANDFTVIDRRSSPFVTIPARGAIAISKGQLDAKEVAVYALINMMLDGVVQVKEDVLEKDAIAHCTGMTPRQVSNIYKKLHEKGVIQITNEEVLI